ncbi:hypothetical protein L0F63_001430 [Massospora cicadina]|nr:hypothetical protein L0F63_001430 [Massospora cicadina]
MKIPPSHLLHTKHAPEFVELIEASGHREASSSSHPLASPPTLPLNLGRTGLSLPDLRAEPSNDIPTIHVTPPSVHRTSRHSRTDPDSRP